MISVRGEGRWRWEMKTVAKMERQKQAETKHRERGKMARIADKLKKKMPSVPKSKS